ncbi:MAG TPA: glycosyltransferase 87 family protein [Candidatus Sulfotelmatobacter sp.]|nr:glycosyltransferase 87 family protein [Candidatus Sulfotelmatobacter sp.]
MHQELGAPRLGGEASRRLLGHAVAVVAIVFVGYYDLLVAATSVGLDSHAYWAAWTHPLYSIPPGHVDAFLYAPVVAEILWPLGHLPADLFIGLWAAAMLAVFAWLLRPLPPVWYLVGLLLCVPEALEGNINALLALMVVVGFRMPAAWALALLTKVSTGVGLLWFVVRGRWRAWLAAAALAAALAAVSYVWWPDPWQAWVGLLVSGSGGGDWFFPARLVVAIALVVWGARTDRRWTVPACLVLASPILFLNTLTILAAIPRLAGGRGGTGQGAE